MIHTEIKTVGGVRNDILPERFDTGDLLYAKNVDIDESGQIRRRLGTEVLFAGSAHSGWTDGNQAYFVQGGFLRGLVAGGEPYDITEVAGARVRYAAVNRSIYWSDGLVSGVITDGVNHKWGITPPDVINTMATTGNLDEGYYLCTITYVNQLGLESGAPRSTSVKVGINGGVSIAAIGVSTDPTVVSKNIYMSACNGELPMLVATIPNAQTSIEILEAPQHSMPVRTQFMGAAPTGQVVGYYNGRTYIADGQYLWFSMPFEFELFDLRAGYMALGGHIQTFAAVQGGIFIGMSDRTVFLRGTGPDDFMLVPISPVGTISGTEVVVQAGLVGTQTVKGSQITGNAFIWTTHKGVVLGMDEGEYRELTVDRYRLPKNIAHGGALLKIRDGTPQYVVSLHTPI